ncbi:MAG TPA: glycosyltransferase family 9 protein [Pyrinomonadaceae bacterium]|jgi:predicted lipopolysaccharide heptosyltransferase III
MKSEDQRPKNKNPKSIDWTNIKRVLVVRLRSIGDTVLTTPSLIALRRFLPDARIDVLLEDWVAPILENFDAVDNVLTFSRKSKRSRLDVLIKLRRAKYDVVFNLHGGTTSTFFVRAAGAAHRVGFAHYRYAFLYNHLLSSAKDFWHRETIHSAEQHLALLGFAGVPVSDKTKTRLVVTEKARNSIENKLSSAIGNPQSAFALIHPTAAFDTKQWATENFARVAEFLHEKGLSIIAIATEKERAVLENLKQSARVPVITFNDLTLPEITALASRAKLFVGNDSGIAHIAAAVETPLVVVFGSSNINHWRPWTNAPNEIVYQKMACQPCAGHFCAQFGEPRCILNVTTESVIKAIEKIIVKGKSNIRVRKC